MLLSTILCAFTSCATEENGQIYSVIFMSGDSVVAIYRTSGNTKVPLPEVESRRENNGSTFYFDGWYINKDYSQEFKSNTLLHEKLTEDIYVYAMYTSAANAICTVTFDYNDPDKEKVKKEYPYRSLIDKVEDPKRIGYIFDGWYLDNDFYRDSWDFENDYLKTNKTLYAKWIINYSKINYELDGGINPEDQQDRYSVDNPLVLKNPTKKGYVFVGWYIDELLTEEFVVENAEGDITLYAKWELLTFNVTYEYGDGYLEEGNENPSTYNFETGLELYEPLINTIKGYEFKHWEYKIGDIIYTLDLNDLPEIEDLHLIAIYGEIDYTINYNVSEDVNLDGLPTSYLYSQDIVTIGEPTRAWYTFGGWYLDEELTNLFDNTNQHVDLELYAKWSEEEYTLSFFESDTKIEGISDIKFSVSNKPISLPNYQKAEYVFIGWYEDKTFETKFTVDRLRDESLVLYARVELETNLELTNYLVYNDYQTVQFITESDTKGISYTFEEDKNIVAINNDFINAEDWCYYATDDSLFHLSIKYEFFRDFVDGSIIVLDIINSSLEITTIYVICYEKEIPYVNAVGGNAFNHMINSDENIELEYVFRGKTTLDVNVEKIKINNEILQAEDYVYSTTNIILNSSYLNTLKVGSYPVEIHTDLGLINTQINITTDGNLVPYNVHVDFDNPGSVYYIRWDCNAEPGQVDYYIVNIGSSVFESWRVAHASLFEDNAFNATLKIPDGSEISVVAVKGNTEYSSSKITFNAPTSTQQELLKETIVIFNKTINTYITSFDEMVDIANVFYYKYHTLSKYGVSGDYSEYRKLRVCLDIDVSEHLEQISEEENKKYYSSVSATSTNVGNTAFAGAFLNHAMSKTQETYPAQLASGFEKVNGEATNVYILLVLFKHNLEPDNTYQTTSTQNGNITERSKVITHYGSGLPLDYVFPLDNRDVEYEVTTSDQLYYAVEKGLKPTYDEASNLKYLMDNAKSILREIIDESMNEYAMVIAIQEWLAKNVVYDHYLVDQGLTGAELYENPSFYMESILLPTYEQRIAVCNSIAKVMSLLCNIMGIESIKISGTSNGSGHAWVKVKIDNKWYVCDPTWANKLNTDKTESITYIYSMMDDTTCEATGHTDKTLDKTQFIASDSQFIVYANMYITLDGKKYSYSLKEFNQLDALVQYYINVFGGELTSSESVRFEICDNKGLINIANMQLLKQNHPEYTISTSTITVSGSNNNVYAIYVGKK